MNPFFKIASITSALLVVHFLLPCQLIGAPRVSLSLDKKNISAQKPFSCELTISWEGDADQYLVDRPRLKPPEGIVEVGSSSSSITRGDQYLLQYRYDLQAEKEGSYVLEPIEISFWAKGNNEEEKINTDKLTITVTSFSLAQYGENRLIPVALVIIVVSLFSALIVIISKKRRRDRNQTQSAPSPKDALASDLTHCNDFKIKGDWKRYIQTALAIRNQLPTEVKGLEELDKLAEKIHYGGFRPNTEEINRIHRQLEQAVKSVSTKDPDRELEGIALR
jgi:hypothetical protein